MRNGPGGDRAIAVTVHLEFSGDQPPILPEVTGTDQALTMPDGSLVAPKQRSDPTVLLTRSRVSQPQSCSYRHAGYWQPRSPDRAIFLEGLKALWSLDRRSVLSLD